MADQRAAWLERVEAWQASGESVAAFCRSRGLTYSQFIYWQRVLRTPARGEAPLLVPLVVEAEAMSALRAPIELALPNGVRLRVPCGSMTDVIALVRGLTC